MFLELMIPPAFVMIVGVLVLPLLPRTIRSAAFLVFPLITLAVLWSLPEGLIISTDFMRYTLILCKVDQLSRVFGAIFAIIAFAGGVYAYHVKDIREQVAALLYGASAIGVTFAGDYLTLFLFWELMALASTYLVWARRSNEAEKAGMRYLFVHLVGGSLLLAGILLRISETGDTSVTPLAVSDSLSSWLILVGVGLNAAIPPLHAWLSDAYPRATVTGAVFLSAFTTKAAVYVLIRVFPGWEILITLGVIMALYGVVFAVLANDIREILAYHIISQVGYMVAGVGIGTEIALNGVTAHAFSHILYKALLFMGAGVVLEITGKSKLTELGGLARAMPLTLWLYMVGAFSISGFPLFNGFISKSMIVFAAGVSHYDTTMLLLGLASVGTFLHTGLKLPYFIWFGKPCGLTPDVPPKNMQVGMALVAFSCILFGVAPSLLYHHLPYPVTYVPYTVPHLVETTQLLVFTFIGFWIIREKLAGTPTITLDTDWFYRFPAPFIWRYVIENIAVGFGAVENSARLLTRVIARIVRNPVPSMVRLGPALEKDRETEDFNPDVVRPKMEFVIVMVLASFIVLALISLLA